MKNTRQMVTEALPRLTSAGIEIDTSPEAFGWLRDSNELLGDAEALRARMDQDGYLFLPGFFDREEVRAARLAVCERLAADDLLDPDFPIEDAIARPDNNTYFRPDIANKSDARPVLNRVIYGEKIMAFYSELLGGPATHYDFTWLRVISKTGTWPHCDVVYMGRGSKNLVTAWTPLGDVPLHVGGLAIVEGSNHDQELRQGYCTMDVDTSCTNKDPKVHQLNDAGFPGFGALSYDMRETRQKLGGRLLTCPEYRMGDLLTFTIYTVHGSLDNPSRQIRLSSDSRYQLASEPLDERWVGENPPAHGGEMVKGMIC